MRTPIVVWVKTDGVAKAIEHILDGSIAEQKPTVMVAPDWTVPRLIANFHEIRSGEAGAGWSGRVTAAAWELAKALEESAFGTSTTDNSNQEVVTDEQNT